MSSADLSSDILPLPSSVEGVAGCTATDPSSRAPRSRPLPARDLFGGGGGGGAAETLPWLSLMMRDVVFTDLRLGGRPPADRTDALRAGGSGGGDNLVLGATGNEAVAAAFEEVRPELAASGEFTKDTELWSGACSPSGRAELATALETGGVGLARLATDDEVNDGRDTWFGRLGGGSAGACMFTRTLDDRDRVESCDDRRIDEGSSVKIGPVGTAAPGDAAESLLSVLE